jgi:hypothetical protein
MHGLRFVYFLPIALLAMTRLLSDEFDLADGMRASLLH